MGRPSPWHNGGLPRLKSRPAGAYYSLGPGAAGAARPGGLLACGKEPVALALGPKPVLGGARSFAHRGRKPAKSTGASRCAIR